MKNDVGMRWEKVILKTVAKISAGQSAPKDSDFSVKDGLPFIRAGHLEQLIAGKNIFSLPTINKEHSLKNRLKVLNKGSILFAKSGMSAMLNRVYLVEQETYYVSHLASVTPDNSVLDSRFCYYFLKHFKTSKLIKDSAYPSIGLPDIEKVEIPLPPLPIQKRIAEILDAADALKRKDQALLKKYDELAQAIFIDMFGANKEIVKLNQITTKITDGVHAKPNYQETGVPFLSVKNATNRFLDFNNSKFITQSDHESYTKRCKPEFEDILYTKVGATYGRAAIVDSKKEFSIYVSLALIKPDRSKVYPYYLNFVLNTNYVKNQADRRVKGAGVPDLHLVEIKDFDIPLPTYKEQLEFSNVIENLNRNIISTKNQIIQSENLFQTLIQKAFKGELVA